MSRIILYMASGITSRNLLHASPSSSPSTFTSLREKPELSTLFEQRYDFYPLIALVLRFRCLITVWAYLNSCILSFLCFFHVPLFFWVFFECRVFLVLLSYAITLSKPLFSFFFFLLFTFLRDASKENNIQSSSQSRLQSPLPLGLRRPPC